MMLCVPLLVGDIPRALFMSRPPVPGPRKRPTPPLASILPSRKTFVMVTLPAETSSSPAQTAPARRWQRRSTAA